MLAEIFSRLDLDSIRNARLVSKWWNEMVLFAIRKRFHLVCPISDSTLSRAVKSKEVLKSLNVRNFTGNGNKVVSATRGTGRLFGCADRIQFTGTNINPAKSLKMMSYAFNTVKELIFKRCGHAIIRPLLQSKQFFHSLNQLTVYIIYLCKIHNFNDLNFQFLISFIFSHCRLNAHCLQTGTSHVPWAICHFLTIMQRCPHFKPLN